MDLALTGPTDCSPKTGVERWTFGDWQVSCSPAEGARLSELRYGDLSLLVGAPANFHTPAREYGRYETRPVYGYDDCFPSIDACPYPGNSEESVEDHGELCWLPWQVEATHDQLRCEVVSRRLPLRFMRMMAFAGARIDWEFTVENHGDVPLPFLHAMHALMPLDEVIGVELPSFAEATEEMHGGLPRGTDTAAMAAHLLAIPRGRAEMIMLRGVASNGFALRFRSGRTLRVSYSRDLFPTLGVWWDNAGYPDEEGLQRIECAFEPLAGPSTSLERSFAFGKHQTALPRSVTSWNIRWEIVS